MGTQLSIDNRTLPTPRLASLNKPQNVFRAGELPNPQIPELLEMSAARIADNVADKTEDADVDVFWVCECDGCRPCRLCDGQMPWP